MPRQDARLAGTTSPDSPDPRAEKARRLLADLLRPLEDRDFAVTLWDGVEVPGRAPAPPRFTVHVRRPEGLRRLLMGRDAVSLGGGYVAGDLDLEGDLYAALELPQRLGGLAPGPGPLFRLALLGVRLPRPAPETGEGPGRAARLRGRRHSKVRDAAAIRHHYEVGNDFYRVFLDRRRTYSCAFFETPDQSLDDAQEAKLDLICRKLRLRPGLRLLDVGCGWGSLVAFAAERYGVDALGINISEAQIGAARRLLERRDLSGRARIEFADYRDLTDEHAFDRVVSVGMYEHVGRENLRTYLASLARCLRPGGLLLNHGIASRAGQREDDVSRFIDRYVFPDGEVLPPSLLVEVAERLGLEVLHVESLRPHYARTLRHWVRRLEEGREAAVAAAGERAYRLWRLYMAGSARAFETGRISVFQVLMARPRPDGSHDGGVDVDGQYSSRVI